MTQPEGEGSYDYTFVTSVARIALYDDLRSAPRVTEIMPASTPDYIEGGSRRPSTIKRNKRGDRFPIP